MASTIHFKKPNGWYRSKVFTWACKGSRITRHTPDRAGSFSGVTGGRALSFHGLSMGEAPGPERMRGEQREGAKLPRR